MCGLQQAACQRSSAATPQSYAQVVALLQRSGAQGLDLLSNVAGAAATGLIGLLIYFAAERVIGRIVPSSMWKRSGWIDGIVAMYCR